MAKRTRGSRLRGCKARARATKGGKGKIRKRKCGKRVMET